MSAAPTASWARSSVKYRLLPSEREEVLRPESVTETVGFPDTPSPLETEAPVPACSVLVRAVPAPVLAINPVVVSPAMAVRSASKGCFQIGRAHV